jgi:excisionase family DNA binding protein
VTGADANSTPDTLEPLLSVEAVSELLGISESGVYRLLRRGELISVKVGGRTLFEPQAVREFIVASRRSSPSTGAVEPSDDQEAA